MPVISRPKTSDKVAEAMSKAKSKYEQVIGSGGVPAFTTATYNKLTAFLPGFFSEIQQETFAFSDQIAATNLKEPVLEKLRMCISHFIQTFNNAIARGVLKPSERKFYKIDANDDTIPSLGKESEVRIVAAHLVLGEAERISRGLAPVTFPAIAEVQALANQFQTLSDQQNAKIDLHDKEQEDLENALVEAMDILDDVWAEVQFTYRKEPPSSMRQNCRLYGITYITLPNEEPEDEADIVPTEPEPEA